MALVILPHVMTARRQIAAQTRLYQSARFDLSYRQDWRQDCVASRAGEPAAFSEAKSPIADLSGGFFGPVTLSKAIC